MELVVAEVVSILGKYAIDKGQGLLREASQAAADAARILYETVMAKLRDDPATTVIADGFETKPDGYTQPVQDALQSKVDADPALAAQLRELMETLKRSTPEATWSILVSGSGAVAVDHSKAVGEGGILADKGSVVVTGGTASVVPPQDRTPP